MFPISSDRRYNGGGAWRTAAGTGTGGLASRASSSSPSAGRSRARDRRPACPEGDRGWPAPSRSCLVRDSTNRLTRSRRPPRPTRRARCLSSVCMRTEVKSTSLPRRFQRLLQKKSAWTRSRSDPLRRRPTWRSEATAREHRPAGSRTGWPGDRPCERAADAARPATRGSRSRRRLLVARPADRVVEASG
jgi:hypothetical protein